MPEYHDGEVVGRVGTTNGCIKSKGLEWPVSQAFAGEQVALRPRGEDGCYGVFFAAVFGASQIASIDLTRPAGVNHVSKQVSTMSPD